MSSEENRVALGGKTVTGLDGAEWVYCYSEADFVSAFAWAREQRSIWPRSFPCFCLETVEQRGTRRGERSLTEAMTVVGVERRVVVVDAKLALAMWEGSRPLIVGPRIAVKDVRIVRRCPFCGEGVGALLGVGRRADGTVCSHPTQTEGGFFDVDARVIGGNGGRDG